MDRHFEAQPERNSPQIFLSERLLNVSSLQNDLGCLIKLWIPGPHLRGPERGLGVGAGTCAFHQQHRRGRPQADKLRTMLTRTYTAHFEFWLKALPLAPLPDLPGPSPRTEAREAVF